MGGGDNSQACGVLVDGKACEGMTETTQAYERETETNQACAGAQPNQDHQKKTPRRRALDFSLV